MWEPSGRVEVVAGVEGPERVRYAGLALHPGRRVAMEVRFDAEAGRYVCHEITVSRDNGDPVTSEVLRSVPVGEFIRATLLVDSADSPVRSLPNPEGREPWGLDVPSDVATGGPTRRALEWTAHIYRYALAVGLPPTGAVEEMIGLSRATAGRWVAAARREGLLGPTEAGRAGA